VIARKLDLAPWSSIRVRSNRILGKKISTLEISRILDSFWVSPVLQAAKTLTWCHSNAGGP